MRKNVTVNNYYITQRPQNRPQQRPRQDEKEDKVEYGWAIGMGKNPF